MSIPARSFYVNDRFYVTNGHGYMMNTFRLPERICRKRGVYISVGFTFVAFMK